MALSRLELRKVIREILSDNVSWPDSSINAWINEALRDFSNYFPRITSQDINCTQDDRTYSLYECEGLREVLSVEFPQGDDPPRFVSRLSEKSPNFIGGPYYDLPFIATPGTIVLGEYPNTGDQIGVLFAGDHPLPTSDFISITVKERHWGALVLYVQWQAIRELEMDEAREPDDSNIVLSMLGLNSGRAERLYRSKLREYKATEAGGGPAGPWVMDGQDRIY